MINRKYLVLAAILLLSLPASLWAQDPQVKSAGTIGSQATQVIASAYDNRVRFSSLGALIELRLEVLGPAGDILFDSGFKPGNALDWPGSDNNGLRLADGTYLCRVTVRDSAGRLVTRNAIAISSGQSLAVKQMDMSVLAAAQVHAAGESSVEDNITILDSSAPTATAVLAHDGTTANLVSGSGGLSISGGDFFANKVLEYLRITSDGNVGIGTRTPQFRLDVDGLIRASRGIVYPDGTVQLSASSRTLGAKSLTPDQARKLGSKQGQENFEPQVAGTGTQNHLALWTNSTGTLGDSAIVDVGGDIGIGTNNPQSGLDYRSGGAAFFTRDFPSNPGNAVSALQLGLSGAGSRNVNVGPSFLFFSENTAGAKSFVGRVSAIWENPTAGSEAGSIFFQVRANSADVNALTERMRITAAGNVGIGTGAPTTKLEVTGDVRSSGVGGRFSALNPNNQNALVHYDWFNDGTHDWPRIRYGGNGEGGANGFLIQGPSNVTKLAILNSGNVGIGTTSPATRLEVRDGDVRSTGTGGRFSALNPNNQSALVHFDWFNDGTHDWPRIRYGGSGEGAANGFLIQGPSNDTKLAVLENGNVGIGTAAPATQLHVTRAVTIDSTSTGSDAILFLSEAGSRKWHLRNDGNDGDRFKIFNEVTSNTVLTIESSTDKIGIGTTNPEHKLDVVASNSDGHIAALINTAAGADDADGLIIELRSNNVNPTTTNNYVTFRRYETSYGAIQGNGFGGIDFHSGSADYAEWLPRRVASEQMLPGEIVGLHAGHITKDTHGASRVMAISTGPIVLGNDPGEKARASYEKVAFIGQVMVRVRGGVQAGDFIVASGMSDGTGIAVSPDCITSEQFEQVVGQAWESSSDPGVKSVRTAVGLIQRDPTVQRLLEDHRRQAAQIAALKQDIAAFRDKEDAMNARISALELRKRKNVVANKRIAGQKGISAGTATQN